MARAAELQVHSLSVSVQELQGAMCWLAECTFPQTNAELEAAHAQASGMAAAAGEDQERLRFAVESLEAVNVGLQRRLHV
jgi:hypothetical protein